MDVELYVYDLSKGLARQFSTALLGINIDAVYHTSIVFGGAEYLYGHGVQSCYPGCSHHGAPMETVSLGRTHLDIEVILEYLESLKQIYTVESYDLFLHNCNNFSNDFAMFLVGRGIPDHITSLPQTVLNTPFGQMLKPQLDSAMRSVTQAPVPSRNRVPSNATTAKPAHRSPRKGAVQHVENLQGLEKQLASASSSCAIIFFTSANCGPCRILYPVYDQLAAETGRKGVLIMVDISKAFDVGEKYGIRATPTFVSFLHGQKENQWSGADEGKLRGNMRLLVQMAWPPHPHTKLELPILSRTNLKPVTYGKLPPFDKLVAKMGNAGKDASVLSVTDFVATRAEISAKEAPLPDLSAFSAFIRSSISHLPQEVLFTICDLFRVALVDPRCSGFFAEEKEHRTLLSILNYVNGQPLEDCHYGLRLVTLQAACNLFTSPLYPEHILASAILTRPIIQLLTTSLLDNEHASTRVVAASLAFNMAAHNRKQRLDTEQELLPENEQVELMASLLEVISTETTSGDGLKAMLLALGFLVYCAPQGGEVVDLCNAMDATTAIKGKTPPLGQELLLRELGEELLGKGLS
ncbi:MAG: hypothetical protein M1835_002858 [Candelina submexicana]|nr:MAG: hypothetical protein M1835_002858 [Candelina submexicana]